MKNIHFIFWTPSLNNNNTSKNLSDHKKCFIRITNTLLTWRQKKLLKSNHKNKLCHSKLAGAAWEHFRRPERPIHVPFSLILLRFSKSGTLLSTSMATCASFKIKTRRKIFVSHQVLVLGGAQGSSGDKKYG